MGFKLDDSPVVLDGNSFDGLKESEGNLHYFAARIDVDGILNFGLVPKGTEVRISLAENDINCSLIVDRIVSLTSSHSTDEIDFILYRNVDDNLVKLGTERFKKAEMPLNYPDGIITPDMVLGVKPLKADATVVIYVKPVKILFEAVPNSLSA